MINATVLEIKQDGASAILRYRLIEDSDGSIVSEGSIVVTGTPDDINTTLGALVDTANYVASLQPLVGIVVKSANPVPDPIAISPDPIIIGAKG